MAAGRSEATSDPRGFAPLQELPGAPPRLAFGPFVLDPESSRLLKGDDEIALAPKPFETLLLLARHPGRLIAKAELLGTLWPDTHVTEDVLVQCVVEIRRALGDHARQPTYVQNVPRRGYRFLEPVRPIQAPAPAFTHEQRPRREAASGAPAPRPGEPQRWRWFGAGLAVASLLWLAASAQSSRRSVMAEPGFQARPGSLVVTPITVQGPEDGDDWLRDGLAEMLRSGLGQRPGIEIVPRHRLDSALDTLGPGGAHEASAGVRLAEELRAERLLTGSFVRIKERFVITAQLVYVPSGQAEGQVTVRGYYPDDLLNAVDELCLKVFERWDAASAPRPELAGFRPVRMATASLDAFRQYSEALVWFAHGGRRGASEAERRLDEAIRGDPSFAYAYLKKAEIQHWLGRNGYGHADPTPAITAALALADDGLPEREGMLVRLLDAALVRKQSAEAIELYEELVVRHRTFAEQVGAPSLMGDLYVREGRWDRLIELGLAHVESPSAPRGERALLSSYLGRAYRQNGEFERALHHASRALRLWPTPDGPGFLTRQAERGRILLDAGRWERALADFEAVAADREADAASVTAAAWGFYLSGDRQRAAALAERATGMDPGYGNAHHLLGWLALARGEYASAAQSLQRAFERTRETPYGEMFHGYVGKASGDLAALYYAGVALAKQGLGGDARRRFELVRQICEERSGGGASEGLVSWTPAYLSGIAAARLGEPVPQLPRLQGDDASYFLLTARLRAVQGDREAALDLLRKALPFVPGDRQHMRDDPNFESLHEDPEFQDLVGG